MQFLLQFEKTVITLPFPSTVLIYPQFSRLEFTFFMIF